MCADLSVIKNRVHTWWYWCVLLVMCTSSHSECESTAHGGESSRLSSPHHNSAGRQSLTPLGQGWNVGLSLCMNSCYLVFPSFCAETFYIPVIIQILVLQFWRWTGYWHYAIIWSPPEVWSPEGPGPEKGRLEGPDWEESWGRFLGLLSQEVISPLMICIRWKTML